MEEKRYRHHRKKAKLGVALVGLGRYSKGQLASALKETKYCQLVGIITGSPEKIPEWKTNFGIRDKDIYSYDNFDEIASNEDIDMVYVVLPNSMHADFTIRAANAGKHVICEKPMAISVEECEDMIASCKKNQVKLSIGYRLHFDPYHQYIMELGQQEKMGRIKTIAGENSLLLQDASAWRLQKELSGGGPLMDVGIYVVQGSCYTLGQSPVAVKEAAFGEVTHPEIYQDVEQSIHWTLEFSDGVLAKGFCSYAKDEDILTAEAEKGSWELKPAYAYNGLRGKTNEGTFKLPEVNQQALQMDAFAQAIIQEKESIVPGEMGLRDVSILMSIYEAAKTGRSVPLKLL